MKPPKKLLPSVIILLGVYSLFIFLVLVCFFQIILRCPNFCYTSSRGNIFTVIQGLGYSCLYIIIFIMWLWSFIKVMISDPGEIPDRFLHEEKVIQFYQKHMESLKSEEIKNNDNNDIDDIVEVDWSDEEEEEEKGEKEDRNEEQLSFCNKCMIVKPERTHHCSSCNSCRMKFDHHCPYVGNCIGAYNYKYFLLMIIYSISFILFLVIACGTKYAFVSWNGINQAEIQIFIGLSIGILFLFLLIPLFLTHIRLLLFNLTTQESIGINNKYYSPDTISNLKKYNTTFKNNFIEIFGDDFLLWFVPIYSSKLESNGLPYYYKNHL